jgi:hypothetical protein
MAYPSLEQYNQAFQHHSMLLADAELRSGTVTTTGLGLPLAISGGFALTYTIKNGANKYAVRCFHRESKALERRYAAISKRLSGLNSPYFVQFQFQPNGIKVDGSGYPIVKMAWAKGETLGEFLEGNRGDTAALIRLSDALIALATFLEKERIAHGDFQTGNLMVSGGGAAIQLIDYDGIYVDEIKDIGSAELGHVNFQHPQRKSTNPFDPRLDRFSLITLFVALKALRVDPSLWQKTKSDVDAILFRANDFADPRTSQTFALLAANSLLATDAGNFAAVCTAPMDRAPSLADFLVGRQIPAGAIALTGTASATNRQMGYISAYEVLSAMDYTACLRQVGNKVEVIGRVVEVHKAKTKHGKPYIFINFGNYIGKIFKVAIWSDGLAALRTAPDSGWIGKWLSVVGLMDGPYVNPKIKYSHLSINITSAGQMTLIAESDAQWRLAGPGSGMPAFKTPTNQDVLHKIRTTSPTPVVAQAPPSATSIVSSTSAANKHAMERIHAVTGSAHPPSSARGSSLGVSGATGGSSTISRSPDNSQSVNAGPTAQPPKLARAGVPSDASPRRVQNSNAPVSQAPPSPPKRATQPSPAHVQPVGHSVGARSAAEPSATRPSHPGSPDPPTSDLIYAALFLLLTITFVSACILL